MKNITKVLHFDAAHYLDKTFGKCQNLHGHRYFVENIVVGFDGIVDFGLIKKAVDSFDHCLLIPGNHEAFWKNVDTLAKQSDLPFIIKTVVLSSMSLVENIAQDLAMQISAIPGVRSVSFDLYEGHNQGVHVDT